MHIAPLLFFPLLVRAGLHSLPEDPYAFPKYRVAFLNAHPVLNHTAEHWLAYGLRGGESEFLEQWASSDDSTASPQPKEIDPPNPPVDTLAPNSRSFASDNYTLEHMLLGPKDSYLCYIPKPVESASTKRVEEPEADPTPARSWSLLQPLAGSCLYRRQGWFTYSYCHNKSIRQFKELAQPITNILAGTYKPEEDPEWESYVLGRAPRSEETGADLTIAEQDARAANLQLARNAGSLYLVQRWGGGTLCDKTGKPREVEVQFHCSMVTTDRIEVVKETKTCSYVVVIHTPRLCAEPGFKSPRDSGEEALIRCRKVVDVLPEGIDNPPSLLISDQPFKAGLRKPVLPAPPVDKQTAGMRLNENLIKQFINSKPKGKATVGDGELLFEVVEEFDGADFNEVSEGTRKLFDILRAAGYNVHLPAASRGKSNGDDAESSDSSSDQQSGNDRDDAASTDEQVKLFKILQEHVEL